MVILTSLPLFEQNSSFVDYSSSIYDIPYKTFRMRKYDYYIWLDVNGDSLLPSYNRMTIEAVEPTESVYFHFILRDTAHGNDLSIDSIRFIHGADTLIPYYRLIEDTMVVVHLPMTIPSGQRFLIEVYYHGRAGKRPSFAWGSSFMVGVYWFDSAIFTHSEYYGTRMWLPVFDNLYEKVDTVDARIRVPYGWYAVSNGRLVDSLALPDGIVYWWRESHGITPYMIVFAALDRSRYLILDSTWTYGDVNMPVFVYTDSDTVPTLRYMTQGLDVFSTLYGIYPFYDEKYSEVHVGGGVEYQTNTFSHYIFGQRVVIHELSHQWWGGYVTCGTYNDLWLNEGFATYSELLYMEFADSTDVSGYRRSYYRQYLLRTGIHNVPLNSPQYDGSLMWTYLVYDKGAAVLHMMRYRFWRLYGGQYSGDSAFFQFLQYYKNRHARSYVISQDLEQDVESFTGVDWSQFFEQWVYTPGHPVLDVRWGKELSGSLWNMAVVINQIQDDSWGFFTVDYPVRIRFSDSSIVDTVLPLTGASSDTFYLSFVSEPVSLIMDPDEHILDKVNSLVAEDEINETRLYRIFFRGDNLFIRTPEGDMYRYRIYSVNGRVVSEGKFRGPEYSIVLDVSPGIYIVELLSRTSRKVFKVIK